MARAIKAVHYAYPPLVFFYYLFAVTVSICTLQTISPKTKDQRVRRDVILGIMVVVVSAYVSFRTTRLWANYTLQTLYTNLLDLVRSLKPLASSFTLLLCVIGTDHSITL